MVQRVGSILVCMNVMGGWVAACDDDSTQNVRDTESGGDTGSDHDSDTDSGSGDPDGTETETETAGTEGESDDAGTATDEVAITLLVPDAFDGTPEIVGVMFYESGEMAGMPDAMGTFISAPEISAGEPYEFVSTQAGLDGDYYVAVTVYCEGGGGGGFPVVGVDWIGGVGTPVTLGPGTGTVNAGEMTLFKMSEK